jgi:hypothetical protein
LERVSVSFDPGDLEIAREIGEGSECAHDILLNRDLTTDVRIGEDWKEWNYRKLRQVEAVIGLISPGSMLRTRPSLGLVGDRTGVR